MEKFPLYDQISSIRLKHTLEYVFVKRVDKSQLATLCSVNLLTTTLGHHPNLLTFQHWFESHHHLRTSITLR